MQKPVDFQNMTLDELTPIVSMRPGKEYTREELRAARAAFMAQLGGLPAEEDIASTENVAPLDTAAETAAEIFAFEDVQVAAPEEVAASVPMENLQQPEVSEEAQENVLDTIAITEEAPEASVTETRTEPVPKESPETTTNEEFILKAESRLARFLYILYAYLLVPALAAEAVIFLLASVAAAVAVPDIPYLFVHILCAVFYTMLVSIAWHQFLFRTHFGLLLNRTLIAACIFRGIFMLLSGDNFLSGFIFVALSSLFLIFFVGYDSTFTVKSPKKPHVQ